MDEGRAMLPVELERRIFELAAYIHPKSALALPGLNRCYTELSPLICVRLDPNFPASLWAQSPNWLHRTYWLYESTRTICAAIVDLAFIAGPRFEEPHPDVFGALSLRRLSVRRLSLSMIGRIIFAGHSTFSLITHLDILDFSDCDHYGGPWAVLRRMPQLTHLSTVRNPKALSDSALCKVLEICEQLEVLVFRYGTQLDLDENRARARVTDDPRFVMLVVPDRVLDWEVGTQGGEDYWAVASALVKLRRNRVDED
ncbi:hypothetical protein B0H12DRAFT_1068687 [Mycena haematopus]|nr:hypothetical protein B0H12DRAFT_1068687 [Mycena haematopus]